MSLSRYKRVKKVMGFYKRTFGFYAPYNILVDGTFFYASTKTHLKMDYTLPKYLQADAKILTTQCIILELENLSKELYTMRTPYRRATDHPVHHCGHESNPLPAYKCIKSLLGTKNPNRYIVATMDNNLKRHIHDKVIGTPILYIHYFSPTLEKPSLKSLNYSKTSARFFEAQALASLQQLKKEILGEDSSDHSKAKKKSKKKKNIQNEKKPGYEKENDNFDEIEINDNKTEGFHSVTEIPDVENTESLSNDEPSTTVNIKKENIQTKKRKLKEKNSKSPKIKTKKRVKTKEKNDGDKNSDTVIHPKKRKLVEDSCNKTSKLKTKKVIKTKKKKVKKENFDPFNIDSNKQSRKLIQCQEEEEEGRTNKEKIPQENEELMLEKMLNK